MFKQILILVTLLGLVLCDEQSTEQQLKEIDQEIEGLRAQEKLQEEIKEKLDLGEVPKFGISQGIVDLAVIGAKNGKRAFEEARPSLHILKDTIGQRSRELENKFRENEHVKNVWNLVSNNQRLKQGLDAIKPRAKNAHDHLSKLGDKLRPHLDSGIVKANSLVETAQKNVKHLIQEAEAKKKQILAEHEKRQALINAQRALEM